jgi:hypothetical protein
MKILQCKNRSDLINTRSWSLFSMSAGHRIFAVLLLLLIAMMTMASMTGGKHSSGGNLILAPGHPGIEPALY